MGDRGNVVFKYTDGNKVYFYTHWSGSSLKQTVQDALKRGKERWDDESYLARIVFSEMIKDDVMDLTGYGIAPYEMDMGELVEVDTKLKTVNGISFESFIEMKFPEDNDY